jgi:hypothetical protein
MADPLSITASCVGVLSFVLEIYRSLLEFHRSARRSRKDVQTLFDSTESRLKILALLQNTIERHGLEENAMVVFGRISACRGGLDGLMSKVNKIHEGMVQTGIRSLPSTLQYPFQESTIAKLKEIVTNDLMTNSSMAVNILHL